MHGYIRQGLRFADWLISATADAQLGRFAHYAAHRRTVSEGSRRDAWYPNLARLNCWSSYLQPGCDLQVHEDGRDAIGFEKE